MEMMNLDHFPGGVPAKVIYELNVEELNKIIELSSPSKETHKKALQVCFIALIAYFEAFMKDHFASIINVCPSLLDMLNKNGQDVTINSADLLLLEHNHMNRIGFLISEKYDFGTASKVNAIYMALLQVSPFSKDQKKLFDQLLNDRNLIVHHGGVYSLAYSKQKHTLVDVSRNAFWNSFVVDLAYFQEALAVIGKLVDKTALATHERLSTYIADNNLNLTEEQQKALDALIWSM